MDPAQKGSGGVGILIKENLHDKFKLEICCAIADQVIGVRLKSREAAESIAVYSVYLPPEGSPHATNNENVLNRLTIEIYKQAEMDNIIVCGDFTARISEKCDIAQWENETIVKHMVTDHASNAQGERFLTFLNDIKGCIINGRVTPDQNDYTSVTSHKGRSVVDYFICRQNDLNAMKVMSVKSIPANERICELCEIKVETEYHFLFQCEKLETHRNEL